MTVCIALHLGVVQAVNWLLKKGPLISQIFYLLFHFIILFSLLVSFSVSGPSRGPLAGVHKTGIRGIQDTRQSVDGKTNDIENNDKKVGPNP